MIIDAHCHMGISWFGFNRNKITADDILRNYDKFGIEKGCLSSWEVAYDFEHGNQEVAQICKEHPDRFIPFAIIAPRDRSEAVEMLERYVQDYGFKGVKIHPSCNRFKVDSKWLMDPLMEKCKQYNLPVLTHAEANGYCHPSMIAALAQRHPDVNIIIAHMGDEGGNAWLDAVEAAKYNKNIYLDTTGVPNEVFIIPTAIAEVGAHKIVWGSDSPICSMKVEMDKILYADAFGFDVTQADKDMILGGTMAGLLGLK